MSNPVSSASQGIRLTYTREVVLPSNVTPVDLPAIKSALTAADAAGKLNDVLRGYGFYNTSVALFCEESATATSVNINTTFTEIP